MLTRSCAVATFVVAHLLPATSMAAVHSDIFKCDDDTITALQQHFKIPTRTPQLNEDRFAAEACVTWPYKPNFELATIAYDAGVPYEKRVVVAVIDSNTGRVASSYERIINEDAAVSIGRDSLKFDTARYQLSKNVRAFALRFDSAAHPANCADFYRETELTLLVPEGPILRSVLTVYMHHAHMFSGCAGDSKTSEIADLTIGIEKSTTNGLYDLSVLAKIVTYDRRGSVEREVNKVERRVFWYDGEQYRTRNSAWWLE